ncbi:unnamed protein product [Mytilus coruscus]|uniref:DZIP3-like HEPN domain-containing protein n=1 Tax=Mytilus coruscus TaxID=42192 RepID=A0A6J8DRL9_MYTCO|nr:unnamed protein product [Mytilus coruscus]
MAAISKREDRFIRLKRMLDLGTEALRNILDTKLFPPAKLQEKLKDLEPSISRQDRNILYPRGGDPVKSCDMDLTALVCVFRNLVLEKPIFGYDCLPKDDDKSFQADVIRLNIFRNKLSHTEYPRLEEHEHRKILQTLIEVGLSYGAHKVRCTYCRLFPQENTVKLSSSQVIPVSDSKVSKTKIERSDSSRSYPEHNFDVINKMRTMRVWQQVGRESSSNFQFSNCFQNHRNLSMMHSTPSFPRDQTNNISNTSVQNVSQSDVN